VRAPYLRIWALLNQNNFEICTIFVYEEWFHTLHFANSLINIIIITIIISITNHTQYL